MEIKVIYGDAREISRGLIKWKNAARRRLCRNNGTGHPSSSPSRPQPRRKPSARVLARFYHGAVYHRLPRQCRCCSHCTAHGDAVLTHILLPNTPTGRIKRVAYDCEPFRTLATWNIKRKEGRKAASFPLNVPSQNSFARLSGTISPIITEKDRTLARASREKWDETKRKCSAPELRSLNCLLRGTNKKYLTRETRVGHRGEFVPGVKANLRSSFLTSVSREHSVSKWEKSLVVCVHKVVCVKDISAKTIYGLNNERKENVILEMIL